MTTLKNIIFSLYSGGIQTLRSDCTKNIRLKKEEEEVLNSLGQGLLNALRIWIYNVCAQIEKMNTYCKVKMLKVGSMVMAGYLIFCFIQPLKLKIYITPL